MNFCRPQSLSCHWKFAALMVPALLLLSASPASADRIVQRFKVSTRPVITIHNPNGKVTIKAWTKSEVMIVADRASSQVAVDAEKTGNRVDITTRQISDAVSPAQMRADYEIDVPEDAELQIHDDSGAVSVSSVLGDMNVDTIGAGVDLEDAAGYLTVKTVGGSFRCLRCAGRLEVSSISGNFRFIDTRSYHVNAHTSTGNILFDGEFLPNGIYRLRNYSGNIEVRFSPGDSFDLSATSLKGAVHNEAKLAPPAHPDPLASRYGDSLFGTFNTGRAKVDLTSFNGTIDIVKRN
ncbi:MAG: DUF4097 family beta strand repeat-containing protein [Candidatus Acidiferrales bacterium]